MFIDRLCLLLLSFCVTSLGPYLYRLIFLWYKNNLLLLSKHNFVIVCDNFVPNMGVFIKYKNIWTSDFVLRYSYIKHTVRDNHEYSSLFTSFLLFSYYNYFLLVLFRSERYTPGLYWKKTPGRRLSINPRWKYEYTPWVL